MSNKNKYAREFIWHMFLANIFFLIVIISVINISSTIRFVQFYPLFSWMNPLTAIAILIGGNIFFTVLSIFYAMIDWRKYNKAADEEELASRFF